MSKERLKQIEAEIKKLEQEKSNISLAKLENDLLIVMQEAAKDGIETMSWNQYTDYFNDGDTCYFHVHCHEESIRVNDTHWEDEVDGVPAYEKYEKHIKAFVQAVGECDDDVLEREYGDHTQVVVSLKDGKIHFKKESYSDHD